jgi:hypothetical protein
MALFGKNKEKKEKAPKESAAQRIAAKRAEKRKADKKSHKQKKKKKSSLLEKAGIKTEVEATPEESQTKDRHQQIAGVWSYLRNQIDNGVEEYFKTGNSDILKQYVNRPALDSIIAEVDNLRQQNIHWSQPDRQARTDQQIEVISEKAEPGSKRSSTFTIQERFKDNSVYRRVDGSDQKIAPAEQKVFQATVEVLDGYNYRLVSVVNVPDPVE